MSKEIACFHPISHCNMDIGDVQIKNIPAGLLFPIAIQVYDYHAMTCTHDQTGC
jgi:hypothetical protein